MKCFVCGAGMENYGNATWFCRHCDVWEVRRLDPYISSTRTVLGQAWMGEDVEYLDHSAGHYPSPG